MKSSPRACRGCSELVVVDCNLAPGDAVAVVASALLLSNSIRRDRCVLAGLVAPRGYRYYVFAVGSHVRMLRPDWEVIRGLAKRLLAKGYVGGLRLIDANEASRLRIECCSRVSCEEYSCNPFTPWLSVAVRSIINDRGGICEA